MIKVTVENNLPVALDKLLGLSDKLDGNSTAWRRLLGAIGQQVEDSTRERFATKRSPDGTMWADILPASHEAKRRKDGLMGGGGILVASGHLAGSIHWQQEDAYSVSIGTDTEYGGYHQVGTQHLLARPFLGLSDDDKRALQDVIRKYLDG